MVLTDPIADMITIIRNGLSASKAEVLVCDSKLKAEILKILKKENFIGDFKKETVDDKGKLKVVLKYKGTTPAITSIRRVSKPGRRIYIGKNKISKIKGGRGKAIISTSRGIMTDQDARKQGIGGEVIIEVW